jgi:hypothetical protein
MCTYIYEHANVLGSAKGQKGWFEVNRANVCYDHPSHAPLDHALLLDFVDSTKGPEVRVGLELSYESAQALVIAITNALESGKIAHAGVHGPEHAEVP